MAGGEHTYRPYELKNPFPRRKVEQRHTRIWRHFVFFHVMADQSPVHGSLSVLTGGLMEEGGSIDLSYLGSSVGERRKEMPFELEVKHVLGQKSQIKMLKLRGVWREDGMQVA